MSRPTLPPAAFFWLFGLTVAWGSGWPIMKYAVGELPIYTFRWITAWGGGVCVLLLAVLQGQSLALPRSEWRAAALAAMFNVTGWFYFTAVALTLLPAGRSAVLAYTMPLWSILAARMMVGDPITRDKAAGLLLGMAAIALLIGEDVARFGSAPIGVLAILGAAASWGVGTVIQKREWRTPLLTLAGWQLMIGGMPMVVMAAIWERDPFAALTPAGAASLLYVILVACLFGYWAWFSIVNLAPTAIASIAVLPVPLVGIVASALMLDEKVGWTELGALALITASLATVMPLPRPWRR